MLCDLVWRLQRRSKVAKYRVFALLHYALSSSPHRLQGGIAICMVRAKPAIERRAGSLGRASIADHHVIARTRRASKLASSVATPEQIEHPIAPPFGRAAQLSRLSFTQS